MNAVTGPSNGEASGVEHVMVKERRKEIISDERSRLPLEGRLTPRAVAALEEYGFRSGERGTHGSRSIMLADLRQLLESIPSDASYEDYRVAIMEQNLLGKGTASNRLWSWKKLRELYGLDSNKVVFRAFRALWSSDSRGRPLLAILLACGRDPLLRMSASVILKTPQGSVVTPEDFARGIHEAAPDRFKPGTLRSIGQNLYASWTQSGHLSAGKVRTRSHTKVTPESVAYALLLGRLGGARGQFLFSTFWTALLDTPTSGLLELAAEASRRGWIDLRRVGSVVEVGFSRLLTPAEEEALRE